MFWLAENSHGEDTPVNVLDAGAPTLLEAALCQQANDVASSPVNVRVPAGSEVAAACASLNTLCTMLGEGLVAEPHMTRLAQSGRAMPVRV
jgi:hypothetical protein